MNALLAFVLVIDVIQEIFDVLVFHYLVVEQVFPYLIELQLPCLDFAINRFDEMDPKFLKIL